MYDATKIVGGLAWRARIMLRALADLAAAAGAGRLEMEVPAVDWLGAALEQTGWELHPIRVFARAL